MQDNVKDGCIHPNQSVSRHGVRGRYATTSYENAPQVGTRRMGRPSNQNLSKPALRAFWMVRSCWATTDKTWKTKARYYVGASLTKALSNPVMSKVMFRKTEDQQQQPA